MNSSQMASALLGYLVEMNGAPRPTTHASGFVEGPVLPATSLKTYLSGMTALNIPAPEGTGGDWHRLAIFGNTKAKLNLAGDASTAFINTNDVLGNYGIYEYSSQLREIGLFIPESHKVYSANHVRAFLDMLIHAADIAQPMNFLQAADFYDNELQMTLLEKGVSATLKTLDVKRAEYLKSWFAQQSSIS